MGAPPPGGGWGPSPAETQGPNQPATAKCDPKGCSNFCMNMRCVDGSVGPDACIAKCQARCGDGYFEEQDAGVMKCVEAVGPSLDCRPALTCCREYLTKQPASDAGTPARGPEDPDGPTVNAVAVPDSST